MIEDTAQDGRFIFLSFICFMFYILRFYLPALFGSMAKSIADFCPLQQHGEEHYRFLPSSAASRRALPISAFFGSLVKSIADSCSLQQHDEEYCRFLPSSAAWRRVLPISALFSSMAKSIADFCPLQQHGEEYCRFHKQVQLLEIVWVEPKLHET